VLRPELGVAPHRHGEAALRGDLLCALQLALDHGSLAQLQQACAEDLPALKSTLRALLQYHLGSPRLRTRDVMIEARQLIDMPRPPLLAADFPEPP
jgi:DNA repair protein RecO (recombination protein O)